MVAPSRGHVNPPTTPKRVPIKNKEKYLPKGNKAAKKRKREEDGDVPNPPSAQVLERREQRRREKKEEKELRRAQKAAATAAGGGEAAEAEPPAGGDAVEKDAAAQDSAAAAEHSEVKETKQERSARRKREKREKHRLAKEAGAGVDADEDAMPIDSTPAAAEPVAEPQATEDAQGEERPRKKRKKDPATTAATATTATTSASATLASTPLASSSSSSSEVSAYLAANNITLSLPPSTPSLTPLLSLAQLPIDPLLAKQLQHFSDPTPIQACAWPALLAGRDVVGIAETGSGKTLAFGVPIMQGLLAGAGAGPNAKQPPPKKKGAKPSSASSIEVLVIAPTRELALQTHDTLLALGAPFHVLSICIFGGVPKPPQAQQLAQPGARIVVGTPGRIIDLIQDGALRLGAVRFLVLDEADRMLDRGFEPDIRAIVAETREEGRQTAMFSATWPESVRRLAATFQRDPVRVTVGAEDLSANKRVEQSVEVLENGWAKDDRLKALLKGLNHKTDRSSGDEARTLVFVLYKKEATRVEQALTRLGYRAGAIHGDMGQHARIKALDEFKAGRTRLLVATDVAARGLDIPNVGTVINYSFPLTIEDYIHRIGRTGRGGLSGKSVTFFTGEAHERALAGELMRVLRDAGCAVPPAMDKFPNTIKKKEHAVYGAFYRDDIPMDAKPKKITFD